MKIKLACGTDDGIEFSNEHFGSSKYFLIYELDLDTKKLKFLEKLENSSPEEKIHGDPKKAKKISELIEEASVLVGFKMGPNIIRIRKKFIPVISREKNIKIALEELKELNHEIKIELNKKNETNKKILYINN